MSAERGSPGSRSVRPPEPRPSPALGYGGARKVPPPPLLPTAATRPCPLPARPPAASPPRGGAAAEPGEELSSPRSRWALPRWSRGCRIPRPSPARSRTPRPRWSSDATARGPPGGGGAGRPAWPGRPHRRWTPPRRERQSRKLRRPGRSIRLSPSPGSSPTRPGMRPADAVAGGEAMIRSGSRRLRSWRSRKLPRPRRRLEQRSQPGWMLRPGPGPNGPSPCSAAGDVLRWSSRPPRRGPAGSAQSSGLPDCGSVPRSMTILSITPGAADRPGCARRVSTLPRRTGVRPRELRPGRRTVRPVKRTRVCRTGTPLPAHRAGVALRTRLRRGGGGLPAAARGFPGLRSISGAPNTRPGGIRGSNEGCIWYPGYQACPT